MNRLNIVLLVSLCAKCWAQTVSPQPLPTSDAQAVSLAQQSLLTLTRGATVTSVTLSGNVLSFIGPDSLTGTATLQAQGLGASRIDLNLGKTTISEVRSSTNGVPDGAWSKNGAPAKAAVQHNSWTDAAWFFPALSSLSQTTNPVFVFKYVGQEQYGSVIAQHIRIFQTLTPTIQDLSVVDFYLDAGSFLPLGIIFATHADQDMNISIPVEIRYANYQAVNGVLVPFHLQRLFSNNLTQDISVTNAIFNTILLPSTFTLP